MDTSVTYYNMCKKAFPEDAEKGVAFKTQDQLQEMVRDRYKSLDSFSYFFWLWVTTKCPEKVLGLNSMEQLWLAFVMKEEYGKVWDGEGWIGGVSNVD